MEYDVTLNQNAADCIKQAAGLTGTAYRNICTGASEFVPYGALDYLLGGATAVILAGMAAFLIAISVGIWRMS